MAIAFTLPFIRLNHITEYAYLSLLMIWAGKKILAKSFDFEKTSLDLPILVFFGWVLLTVPFAADWFYSLGEWQKSIPRFFMFWFVANVVKTEQDVRGILYSFSLGFFLLALIESSYFFLRGANPFSMAVRAGEFSGSSQWFSCMLVIGIPILFLGALTEERRWGRTFYLSALSMAGVALFLVHTRAAWVAVGTQAFFYALLKVTKNWIISSAVVFLAIGLLILFLVIPGGHLEWIAGSKFTDPSTMHIRFNTWALALNDIQENPLTGIGYGKNSFQQKHPDLGKDFHTHIHNFFISSATQVGIPGFLVIAWIFWVIFQTSYKWSEWFSDQFYGKFSLVIFLITLGLIVRMLFDNMLVGNVLYLYMLFLGVFFGHGLKKRRQYQVHSRA